MIGINFVTSTSVSRLSLGTLFVPAVNGQQRFLAGLINNMPTRICLDGEKPFSFADEWSRGPGVAIQDIRIEVDPSSGAPADELHPAAGAIVRIEGATAIMAYSADGGVARSRAFPVYLESCAKPRDIQRGDVAFTRWQIAHGHPSAPSILFEADLGDA